jgi:type II secretory pathway component PulF
MDEKRPARLAAAIFALFAFLFAGELVFAELWVKPTYDSMNIELPSLTYHLLDIADFFVNDWFAALAYLAFVAVGTVALRRVPRPLEGAARFFLLGLGVGLVVVAVPFSAYFPICKLGEAVQ